MLLVFWIVCLAVVMLTLELFIVSGFYARSHRMLPLVLGLLALYDFYLIVEHITGQQETFDILNELLLIQLLDVILYYIVDFVKVRIALWQNATIIILLLAMDILIFTQVGRPGVYRPHVVFFVIVSVIYILYFVLRQAPDRSLISRQTRKNNNILLAVIFVPAITLILSILNLIEERIFLPIAIDISCLIIDYLFLTDRLREVDSVLKEEHFQTLDFPAFIFDTDLFFLDASKKARELFSDEISVIEKSPNEYELQKELRKMQINSGVLHRNIGGRFYRCELQAAQYKGKQKGYILTFVDITEQKNETELAKEVARQKSEFLANMSHDLRSPLHAIIGSSEIVLSGNENETSSRTRTMINHIHEAGQNLLDIVNSILDFSKLESGKLRLHPQKYNFKNLIEEQAAVGFVNLRDKAVAIKFEVVDPFPEYLYGDEMRVRQIVQNLISNAVKFTDKGHIYCRFNVAIEESNTVKIRYSVEDTGSGMTKEQIDSVFNDYVTYAQDHKKEGTGLGLSIVSKLAEMMGGRAWAESDGENGSTVYVEFTQKLVKEDISNMEQDGIVLVEPLTIQEENEIDESGAWKNEVIPNRIYPDAKVLIADDMAVNCRIFKELVRPWELQIDVAKDGQEAVNMALKKEYDLIFLDQMMPVMTGTEAADRLEENNIKVPKILLTANITEAMKESSKKHGFKAFMHKPIDIAQLRTNIERFLPEELGQEYIAPVDNIHNIDIVRGEKYAKALSTYIGEMEELYKVLPAYARSDMGMFKNKVHGIKGVSRQLGKEHMAYAAEIMEMAAMVENQDFINRNFESFYSEMEYVINASHQELKRLNERIELRKEASAESANNDRRELSVDETVSLISRLDKALEDYEMAEIDDIIDSLKMVVLSDDVWTTLKEVIRLYEDMEYDDAREALKGIQASY